MEYGTYSNIFTTLFSMLIKVSLESGKKPCKPSHSLSFTSTYFHFSDLHLSDCWLGRLHRMAVEITWLISHIGIRVWICERACLKVQEEKRYGVQVFRTWALELRPRIVGGNVRKRMNYYWCSRNGTITDC